MTCATCGAPLRPGAMFCGECGARVETPLAAPAASIPPPPPAASAPSVPAPPAPPQPTEPVQRLIENLPLGLLEQSAPPPAAAALSAPAAAPPAPPAPAVADESASAPAPASAEPAAPVAQPAAPHEPPVAASAHAAGAQAGTDLGSDAGSAHDDWDETVLSPRRTMAWRIVTSAGDRHAIRTATIIGRSPTGRDGASALALLDATKSLSKSHARLDVTDDGLWITDLGSTNGTIVHDGTVEFELAPGERQLLTPGMRLELGEYELSIVHE